MTEGEVVESAVRTIEVQAERIAELAAALRECRDRFHACCMAHGNNQEVADAACKRYDDLLSKK